MRRCIFCGDAVLTKEDVWPQWVISLLKKSTDEIVPMQARRNKDPLRKWSKMGNRALEFNGVCQSCNNGRMSACENETAPILIPMITNHPATLDSVQQLQIVQWTMKCAMLFESMDGGGRFYTDGDRSSFRATLVPPGDFLEIWLAHYSGAVFRAATDHKGVLTIGASGRSYQGHMITMIFGSLAIQVLNFKCFTADDPTPGIRIRGDRDWSDYIMRLDPAIADVQWPPKLSLDDSHNSLQAFSKRFITTRELVS